jgi:hypothetical protein
LLCGGVGYLDLDGIHFSVCVGRTCFYGVQIDFSWQLVCPGSILCRPKILQGCGVVLHHLQSSKTHLFFCF